jgi:hypothetical protein
MRNLSPWAGAFLCLAACLWPVSTSAQETASRDSPHLFTPQQLAEDFRIFRAALEEGHPGIYRYRTKAEMDQRFAEAAKKLDHPMDTYGFYRILAPIVAAIGCGHTGVNVSEPERERFAAAVPVLPFRVYLADNKVYIFRDYSGEGDGLAGSEIRTINGMGVEKIVTSLMQVVQGDGEIPTSRRRGIEQGIGVGLVQVLGMSSPYVVTYRQAGSGQEGKVTLPGLTLSRMREISRARYPQDNRRPEQAADLKFLDEEKTAVMRIYGFGGYADKEQKKPLEEFFRESFTLFQSKGTKTLILDLRDNGGGEDALGKLLFSYLTDQPFTYYDDLLLNALDFGFMRYARSPLNIPLDQVQKTPEGRYRMTGHPNWGLQQPSKPTFKGKVIVLINGGSFSTTSEFLSIAHFHRRAVFVGEEAAGGYYGNNSGFTRMVTLPNTKVVMRVAFMKYVMAVRGYRYPKRGVMPDYPVRPTIADRLAGRDPEMEAALALARKPGSSDASKGGNSLP